MRAIVQENKNSVMQKSDSPNGYGAWCSQAERCLNRVFAGVTASLALFLLPVVSAQAPPGQDLILTNIDNGNGEITIVAYGLTGGAITLLSATNALQLTNSSTMHEVSTKLASRDIATYWSISQGTNTNTFYKAIAASVTNFNINIISLPEDDVIPTNGFTVFTVVAENAITPANQLLYQWYKNDFPLLNQTNASLGITNAAITDVGFYTCALRTSTNARPLTVLGRDGDAPGARLYIYTGDNTAIHGPYQPAGTNPDCIGDYTGFCLFKDDVTGRYSFPRPAGSPSVTITDTTSLSSGYLSRLYYYENYTTAHGCQDGRNLLTFAPVPWMIPSPSSATRYQFSIYAKTSPFPPTIGTDLTLDVHFN
jgi:hypothetical protein